MSDNTWLDFDGVDDYASAAHDDSLSATGDFTLAVRVRSTASGASGRYPVIAGKGPAASTYQIVAHSSTDSVAWYAQLYIASVQFVAGGTVELTDGAWHTLIMGRASNILRIWEDGAFVSNLTASTGTIGASGAFTVASDNAGAWSGGYFDGDVAEVWFYNRILTNQEAADLHAGSPPASGRVSYWPIDEGTGTTAADAISTADFTITGATWVVNVTTETEIVLPDTRLASTNLQDSASNNPPTLISDLTDDPEAPDANWWTAVDATLATDARLGFVTPVGTLSGTQTVQLLFRKTAGTPNPTVAIELWENGTLVRELVSGTAITSTTGQIVNVTFAASELVTPANAEFRFVSTPPPPARSFEIDPAVESKTTWDLDVDGPMTVNGPGTWTITPTAGFSGSVALWAGGGGSGGHGATTATAGGAGGNTTFSGLTANGGNGSLGRTDNTAGTNATGGTASGGDTNTTGGTGATAPAIGNTSTGGSGGSSPNGGAEVAGTSGTNGVSTAGTVGNAPGGGASGGARGSLGGTAAQRRAVGGGGGGGYSVKAYAVNDLTVGTPITLTVGATGAAGTGDQSAGSAGAAGRATIT